MYCQAVSAIPSGHVSVVASRPPRDGFRSICNSFPRPASHDRCQCPAWGYVFIGKVTFRYADRDEVFESCDAFYTPSGHVPVKHDPGAELLMFQPRRAIFQQECQCCVVG